MQEVAQTPGNAHGKSETVKDDKGHQSNHDEEFNSTKGCKESNKRSAQCEDHRGDQLPSPALAREEASRKTRVTLTLSFPSLDINCTDRDRNWTSW